MLISNLRNVIFFLHAVFSQAFLRQKFIPDERRFSKKCERKYENEQLLSSKLNPKLFWWTIFQQLVPLWKLPIHFDPQRGESLVKGYFLWSTNLSCTFLNCRSCLLKVTIFSNVSAPWNYNGIIQIYFSFFCFQSIHISSFLLQSSAVWH